MRAVHRVVDTRLLPRDVDARLLLDSIEAMSATGLANCPDSFFAFTRELDRAAVGELTTDTSRGMRRVRGGRIRGRALRSRYCDHALLPVTATQDRTVMFEHWLHNGRARGTVIVLHGFAMGWPLIDGLALSARRWFELGLNVVLLTLPDHGPRRAPGTLLSGQRYTVPHAMELAGAVRQAVCEILEVRNWLRADSDLPVGLLGMSLGGYLASVCAGLSKDFDFVIPMVPPACIGDLAWRVYRETRHHRAHKSVLSEQQMRTAFYLHSPLAHERKIAKRRLLIIAGAGDRIIPPEHPTALWQHWGKPQIHWLRGNHMAPVISRDVVPLVANHLIKLKLL
ncbi:MAG: prolyl oligopeptidase family serine peptidase [Pseudomonadota bacterium]